MDSKTLVLSYLDEAHALETALVGNLAAHIAMTTDEAYRTLLEQHLADTRKQVVAIDRRRKALGGDGGRGVMSLTIGLARDAIGQVLVLTKGPLDLLRTPSQPERMLKNAKDECATEALEIATYEHLEATAAAAGDTATAKLAADHRATEEAMLADLRKQIAKLAVTAYEIRTGESAKPKAKASAKRRAAPSNRRSTAGSRS